MKFTKNILFIIVFYFIAPSLLLANKIPLRYKCVFALNHLKDIPYEFFTPSFNYPNPQIGRAVATVQIGPRRIYSKHDRALSYLLFIELQNPMSYQHSLIQNGMAPLILGSPWRISPFTSNGPEKNQGPAYQDEHSLNQLTDLLKRNPLIEMSIQNLDLYEINMNLMAKNHPALFQVILHSVLKNNHDIKLIAHFINAIPASWLKKTISRSFLLDESENSTIRKISNLLLDLGRHDLYTREHSVMVGLWSLKFYLYLATNTPDKFKELSYWYPVGKPIDVIGFLSKETKKNLQVDKTLKVTEFDKRPITIVNLRLSYENMIAFQKAARYFSKATLALLKSTSGPLQEVLQDLHHRIDASDKGAIEKLLILAKGSDLEILKKFELSFNIIETHHALYLSRVSFDFDAFIEAYGGPLREPVARSLEILFWGASSHDVGKTEIPLAILNKRGKLDSEETAIMRSHVLASFGRILNFLKSDPENIGISLPGLLHHERMSGLGYPLGIQGQNLPLQARIIAIADSFHAMTSDRPYRSGMSFERALGLLKERPANGDVQWDPELVDLFEQFIDFELTRE